MSRGSYEAGCAWGRPGSIQGRQECVAPWTGGCSVFTYMYVGNTGPFTGRGCCQVTPPPAPPPGGRRLHLLLLRARQGAGRLQRHPGAKVTAHSKHTPPCPAVILITATRHPRPPVQNQQPPPRGHQGKKKSRRRQQQSRVIRGPTQGRIRGRQGGWRSPGRRSWTLAPSQRQIH